MQSSLDDTAAPQVITRRGRRTLEFSPGDIQSEMRLARPWALVLAYSRAMMCFALFVPRPRHIVMVGLGGGSLAKFCHRAFPHTHITVIEVRADVIALRAQFCIPPDDARFRIVDADAVDWLADHPACCDVIVLDGFDRSGLPPALASAAFYGDCRRALLDDGVLVANLFDYDPAWQAMLARLDAAFEGKLCWFDGIAASNHLVFAVTGAARPLRLQRRIRQRHGRGSGLLARLLARALVTWLGWRRVAQAPQQG
ncbi:fused MFS/spermidine synthase [Massilia sp. S19_KUP03_FR1]|uniref:fused MFS/spermidine synthase n=1 Tax=Massilia sp. S19_KUP03_FR1 TaxID=3025503 RepID=UPI002FCD8E3A